MAVRRSISVLFLLIALGASCRAGQAGAIDSARADSIARARQDSINRTQPGYIVDSILPVEEELRRFRADIAEAPTAFAGGADSRDALVRAFVKGMEARDTTSLIRLLVTRAEFAYLIYPSSPWTKPPYRQAPGLVWMQAVHGSRTGLTRLVDRMAGSPLGFQAYFCKEPPERQGENRIWRDCRLRLKDAAGDTVSMQLFAGIVARGGRFKIYSYANDL